MSNKTLPERRADETPAAFFPTFQQEMNRLLDQFRTGWKLPQNGEPALFSEPVFPAMDIVETDDAVKISAEVPGVKEEDLDASILGDVLVLKGEKSADHEESEDNYHRIERQYGSFRRQIPLGFTPEDGAVSADFADGILKLEIAKPATAKPGIQKINIKKT